MQIGSLFLNIDLGNSRSNGHGKFQQNEQEHCPVAERNCWYADWRNQKREIVSHQWRQHDLKITYRANCDVSCLSHAVSIWIACNLYDFRLFRNVLWAVDCGTWNSALVREIGFFGLRMKTCLTRSSSDLLGVQEIVFFPHCQSL
jgi:hypothetical protein